jgi:hypothetical protein
MARQARIADLHRIAAGMPHVTKVDETQANPVYLSARSRSCSSATARPDAFDPETGERYDDVIVIWVASEDGKQALAQDDASPS